MEKLQSVLELYDNINAGRVAGKDLNKDKIQELREKSVLLNESQKAIKINTSTDDVMLSSIKDIIDYAMDKGTK